MPICSASQEFVWPWRRSSSRIMLPMCICMVVCFCASGYRIHINIPTTADKKEGEQSRLQLAVVGLPFTDRQNARLSASICFLPSVKVTKLKFPTFQAGRDK